MHLNAQIENQNIVDLYKVKNPLQFKRGLEKLIFKNYTLILFLS